MIKIMSGYPSQLRQSRFNQRWVLVAAGRAKRPHQFADSASVADARDPFDPATVKPEDIITARPDIGEWQAVAIPNAFPFLIAGDDPDLRGRIQDGYGFHELVIHSRAADQDFEQFEPTQTARVLEIYAARYRDLAARPHIKHVQIFTNRGHSAGASVRHPHSQIVALPVVPPHVAVLQQAARQYHERTGRGVADDELVDERDQAERIVMRTDHFLAYCPFASHVDHQVRIIPLAGDTRFETLESAERLDLAAVINETYRKLDTVDGIPPYNAFLRTTPVGEEGAFRWHFDIMPRRGTPGGLELATGLDVITVPPETAAASLREA